MTAYDQLMASLPLTSKKWLITGVAGFIGSNLLETLLKLDQLVVGLDNFATGHQHWVEEGVNKDEALAMLKRAVELRPEDGFIIDSLGWAYYRVGDYQTAIQYLEQAIQLEPGEATINDHLGDAYWRVGRRLEAKYQWQHALTLKPEKGEEPRIRQKIEAGLPNLPSAPAQAGTPQAGQ